MSGEKWIIRRQKEIRYGIIGMHVLGAYAFTPPFAYRHEQPRAPIAQSVDPAQTPQPCPDPRFREPYLPQSRDSLYIELLLEQHNLVPTKENKRNAEKTVQKIRDRHGELVIFEGIALFGAGSDRNCRTQDPLFRDERVVTGLRRYAEEVRVFSGITETGEVSGHETTAQRRNEMLGAIETVPTRVVAIFSMHGIESGEAIKFDSATPLTPEELAIAYFNRYQNEQIRRRAQRTPEFVILETCGSGAFRKAFLDALREMQIASNAQNPRNDFRLTSPLVITAGTGSEIVYVNQLLIPLLAEGRLHALYGERADVIGTEKQYSDPEVYAPHPDTGEPIKIVETHLTNHAQG